MIINIAGTSGSGKSTLARWIMDPARGWDSVHEDVKDGRVIGTLLVKDGAGTFVCGRYDDGVDTGGCDTIKNVEFWYNTVEAQHALGRHVIFEGLFVMNHTRGIALVRKLPGQVVVIRLTTELDVCRASVNERRARRGDPPKTDGWHNTEGNHVRARNFTDKLRAVGATVYRVSREAAQTTVAELLGLEVD